MGYSAKPAHIIYEVFLIKLSLNLGNFGINPLQIWDKLKEAATTSKETKTVQEDQEVKKPSSTKHKTAIQIKKERVEEFVQQQQQQQW